MMDLREIEKIVKEKDGDIVEKKETIISKLNKTSLEQQSSSSSIDSCSALQLFLDHIPISSIPGINSSSSVLELKTHDSLSYAIQVMYEKNVYGALIKDVTAFEPTTVNYSNPYIGIIDFASMILWLFQEYENYLRETREYDGKSKFSNGILSMLEHIPHIAKTKIGELAKAYMWQHFVPVNLNDTLFHVLLMLSKHQFHVVPIMEGRNSIVTGFVTESAVFHLLLESSGLEWFDSIADKPLSDFRFGNDTRAVSVYEDQSIAEAMNILWVNRTCAIAVVERETERLIGCVRTSDVHLLLDNEHFFNNIKTATVGEFIRLETPTAESDPTIDRNIGTLLSVGSLNLRNKFLPKMELPVTSKKTDTLKQVMERLARTKSNFSFLVDESERVTGLLTLRDVIVKFAPPCMDSTFTGGGFFQAALQQTGCDIKNGTLVCEGKSVP